jgi:hypothetical protein
MGDVEVDDADFGYGDHRGTPEVNIECDGRGGYEGGEDGE